MKIQFFENDYLPYLHSTVMFIYLFKKEIKAFLLEKPKFASQSLLSVISVLPSMPSTY